MYSRCFKRLFDFLLALVALVILSPLLLAVAIAIYFESGAPIFYRQIRVGLSLKPFSMFKFRSMVINADKVGGYSTSKNDARITRAGQFIRTTSLDELPQLLNVLTGDMSLVGPRPDVPAQVEQYKSIDVWTQRHKVRPGITGLAQAMYRSSTTLELRQAADLEYGRNITCLGDLKIIFMTFKIVFARRGAN